MMATFLFLFAIAKFLAEIGLVLPKFEDTRPVQTVRIREFSEAGLPPDDLKKYRNQLNVLRREFSVRDLPEVPFFQFGMGNRKKLIYKWGKLYDP